jgi:hypothetical protein
MGDLLIANFKGVEHRIVLDDFRNKSLVEAFDKLSSELGIAAETMKVILPGGKLLRAPSPAATQTVLQAGEVLCNRVQGSQRLSHSTSYFFLHMNSG